MRIAELSRRAGVPVPTVKYYLREGLLPPGERSSPNQARYGEQHLRRLRLVRALQEVGRLPIATIRELLSDLEQPDPDVHHALGRAVQAIPADKDADEQPKRSADHEVDELITRHGWQVGPGAPARRTLADIIETLHQLGMTDILAAIDEYADAVETIAAIDLELVRRRGDPESMVLTAVLSTILGDAVLAALRRLAQQDASAKLFRRDDADA